MMRLEITIKGLREAVFYFRNLGYRLKMDTYDGMMEATGAINEGINTVVPHKGYHLDKSGADYHIFYRQEYPNEFRIVCGPSAPYVPILEWGTDAMIGEFQPVYRQTKRGQLLVGLRFVYEGIPDVFFVRPGTSYPAKHYLERSLDSVWEKVKGLIIESVRRAIRR